jgi:hypothetical protein
MDPKIQFGQRITALVTAFHVEHGRYPDWILTNTKTKALIPGQRVRKWKADETLPDGLVRVE